ncbi:hypothetical protein I2I11_06975 [Pontibacter sp. 172403-2]|uniref:hypothetical protein n=1 Tax=Pontibacter rufus TaxID=2791028 RepID=UPI0018AF96C1|nr:hypothetical protein [Pontibacter sp. 172403-2]MBF9253028.1 hypothetical protein [Pontibacter sp. 172403-2]
MNKNVLIVFAAVCGLCMVSCGDPSDLRPEEKVSVDVVEPGTRDTYNIGKVNSIYDENDKEQVMPNRDRGGNSIQKADSVNEASETNTAEGADID